MEVEDNIVDAHKGSLIKALILPFLFSAVMWGVKLIELLLDVRFTAFGIYPRKLEGLVGIITSPFIHADFLHLISNTIPLIILGTALIFFYKVISLRVFILIFLLTGIWVWLAGRPSYHIGASGIVYGLAFFLFLSGIFRRDRSLMAFSLLVVFLYGSIIWGILPIETGMSWEGHLFGALSGIICAFAYKKEGPQRKRFEWEFEEDDDDEITVTDEQNIQSNISSDEIKINYTITGKENKENKENKEEKN